MVSICISVVSTHQNELIKYLLDDLAGISFCFEVQVILRHNLPEPSIGVFDGLELKEIWNDARAGFAVNHNANFSLCHACERSTIGRHSFSKTDKEWASDYK